MSQGFRTAPRQIGFKPQANRLSATSAPNTAAEAAIRKQLQLVQQSQAQVRLHEERLKSTLAPPSRKLLEEKLQALKAQLQTQQRSLRELRGQARLALLKPLAQELRTALSPSEDPKTQLAHTLRQQLASLDAIYRVHQPLPAPGLAQLSEFTTPLQGLLEALQGRPTQADKLLASAQQALEALAAKLWPPEGQELQALWQSWSQALRPHLHAAPRPAPAEPDFEPISFSEALAEQGELELSFDFSARKSVVRNQLGITLNQPKKSYQDYLDQGFGCLDQTVASRFQDRKPLFQAVEHFLEAISLDKSRYEAYFGLGYLYSLVQDLNHALYFLEIAWKISGDLAIQEMMGQLRQSTQLDLVAI